MESQNRRSDRRALAKSSKQNRFFDNLSKAPIAIIQVRFLAGEERFLTELFGDEYLAYKRTTRRWL